MQSRQRSREWNLGSQGKSFLHLSQQLPVTMMRQGERSAARFWRWTVGGSKGKVREKMGRRSVKNWQEEEHDIWEKERREWEVEGRE